MSIKLQAHAISCERNQQSILQNISFTVQDGEILQIAGMNGSGKTTLLRILCGLLMPSSGNIQWCDTPITQCRENYLSELIYVGHHAAVKTELTVQENITLWCTLATTQSQINLTQALVQVGLIDYQHDLVQTLSAGQRRRLALAKLILFKAKLWILDEPFTALDHSGVNLMENLIAQHVAQEGMVILTSHQAFELKNIKQQKLLLGEL